MQRILNQKFILHIDELNKKQNDKKVDELEKKFDIIAENYKILQNSNMLLKCEIDSLKMRIHENQKDTGDYEDMMESGTLQVNTNHSMHSERIFNLERTGADLDKKVANIESADLYLQGSHMMLKERMDLGEKYSEHVEEKVNLLINKKHGDLSGGDYSDPTFNLKQEELEDKLNVLKRTVQDVQNNMEIHDRIFDIEENLTVEEAVKTIKDEKENQITKMSENMSKEEDKSMNTCDALENENLSPKSDLIEKFTKMVNKIENMESILERQTECLSQLLSNNINTEKNYSLKVFKGTFLEIESDSQKMYTRGELVNENIAKDVSYLKEEISNIKQNLQIYLENDSESCRRLANVENHLCKLFGENEKHYNI